MKKETKRELWGYLLFFITFAVAVTVALTVFMTANRLSNGNTAVIAVSVAVTVISLSAVCTFIDVLRRRQMVDEPVRRILDATEAIASGDFSTRLYVTHPYEKYDDYDLIMENLNKMAAELSKSELLKTDFISNVSHELKTPLSIIRSYATLLEKDGLPNVERKKYVETLKGATTRLSELVSNILRLNKLENQELSPESERVQLHELLAEIILAYEDLLEGKGLSLHCELDEVTVISSPSLLEIIFHNLISNAVKFTDVGGVTVTLKEKDGNAVVTVSDTGCGISPAVGSHIFDKFYQGDTSHKGEGNGLGLSLVKKVIDVVGGEISVTSEEKKGSSFTILLNKARKG